MSERNYYVLCDDNCRFPAMTYEQVLEAIAEATGETPTHVEDAFITKIKEQNEGDTLKIWRGSEAQYNALESPDSDTIYLIATNTVRDPTKYATAERVTSIESDIEALEDAVSELPDIVSDAWSILKTYTVGEYCIYDSTLWRSKVQHSGQTPTEGTYWTATSVALELGKKTIINSSTSLVSTTNYAYTGESITIPAKSEYLLQFDVVWQNAQPTGCRISGSDTSCSDSQLYASNETYGVCSLVGYTETQKTFYVWGKYVTANKVNSARTRGVIRTY